ncbi:MAG: DUF3597 domain-containing protein [Chthoniobacterales bacterium]|nr:DUF3597 domain-containing protein [Chthoniobacterales bacterium]
MGLLATIINKVFGGKKEVAASEIAATAEAPAAAAAPVEEIDVTAYLNDLSSKSKEKLDWKVSIVDLMKLVGMDSSLAARKELAKELNYPGDTADSAKMNIWLHKQVLQQIAKNGGKLPSDLLA